MNEMLAKAVAGFEALDGEVHTYNQECVKWAEENGIDLSTYEDIREVNAFFKSALSQKDDDKYITGKFFLRYCPDSLTPNSQYIKLFERYGINEVVVTMEAKVCVITSLMAVGYKATPIYLELTDKWSKDAYDGEKNKEIYGNAVLLTK